MAPIDTSDMYRSADILFANDNGKIMQTVVIIDYKDLNRVIPSLGSPVISFETPKLLQHITKSFVTIINLKILFLLII
jgi:hypothetical protein